MILFYKVQKQTRLIYAGYWGGRWGDERKGAQGGTGNAALCLGVDYMGSFSFWKLTKLYVYDMCTFLYV